MITQFIRQNKETWLLLHPESTVSDACLNWVYVHQHTQETRMHQGYCDWSRFLNTNIHTVLYNDNHHLQCPPITSTGISMWYKVNILFFYLTETEPKAQIIGNWIRVVSITDIMQKGSCTRMSLLSNCDLISLDSVTWLNSQKQGIFQSLHHLQVPCAFGLIDLPALTVGLSHVICFYLSLTLY